MFSKKFQRKYALTDQGLRNTKKGAFWTVIVNLVVMGGMGILYLLTGGFMNTLITGSPLPSAMLPIALTVLFLVLSILTHLQQYRRPALAWRSGSAGFLSDTSENGMWRT